MNFSSIILTLIILFFITACGQQDINQTENKQAFENIKFVFDDYVKYQESTDSKEDKSLMTKSIESLNKVTNPKDLDILINVWMYYDPTDFHSISQVEDIIMNSRPESITAVKLRISNKKGWETIDSAPYSDLFDLLEQIETNKTF